MTKTTRKKQAGRPRPGGADRTRKLPGARRQSIRSILVPLDFSKPSERALEQAATLAREFGAKLTVLNVVEPIAMPDFAYYPLMMENDKVVASAHKRLTQFSARQGIAKDLVEKVLVRNGPAHREITDAARTLKSDLIVIATHGHTGLAHVLLGSTAERVVRHAECPVLVVRGVSAK